jgi:tetratricopeptide (TPR) repeat protein
MNKQVFLNLLKNPDTISAKDLEGLEEVISNFPFCQVAHILAAKGANDQGKMLSDLRIRKAASYAAERRTLKKIIKTKPVATTSLKEESNNKNSLVSFNEAISIPTGEPLIAAPMVEISTSNNNSFEEQKLSLNKNLGIKAEEKKEKRKARISEATIENEILPQEENKPVLIEISPSDNFFSQLEENLSQLQISRSKANQDLADRVPINIPDRLEDKTAKSDEKTQPLPIEAKELNVKVDEVQALPVEVQEIKVNNPRPITLLTDSHKEHSEDTNIFSRRLDEVIEDKSTNVNVKVNEVQALPFEIQEVKVNNPSSTTLLTDSLKEHSEEVNIFSSRLDEVIEDKSTNVKPIINEADLLLNYLAFLNSHKSTVIKDKKKTEDIIEQFIKKDPSIPYMNNIKLPEEHEDKASQSYQVKGAFVSENMAKIYIKQEKFDKAIEIYQQLMLKNPEKKPYFVTQIEKLKSNS